MSEQRKKTALIVDDERDICYLLSNILKQKDIQASFAYNLAEADKMLQSSNFFYFIFLDNHLPDGFGIDQINRWKKKFPLARLIMITAHDTSEDRRKAKTEGADFFICKPFSKEMILNTIETFPV